MGKRGKKVSLGKGNKVLGLLAQGYSVSYVAKNVQISQSEVRKIRRQDEPRRWIVAHYNDALKLIATWKTQISHPSLSELIWLSTGSDMCSDVLGKHLENMGNHEIYKAALEKHAQALCPRFKAFLSIEGDPTFKLVERRTSDDPVWHSYASWTQKHANYIDLFVAWWSGLRSLTDIIVISFLPSGDMTQEQSEASLLVSLILGCEVLIVAIKKLDPYPGWLTQLNELSKLKLLGLSLLRKTMPTWRSGHDNWAKLAQFILDNSDLGLEARTTELLAESCELGHLESKLRNDLQSLRERLDKIIMTEPSKHH